MKDAPGQAIGDGVLCFWKALDEVVPTTKRQRYRVHKIANILDRMPKSIQGNARSMIHEMDRAGTEEHVRKACHHVVSIYGDQYPRAVDCLRKDESDLFTFYGFPGIH